MRSRLGREERATRTSTRGRAEPGARAAHPLEHLQRTIGNRVVCSRLVLQAPDGPLEREAHRVAADVTAATTDHAGLAVSRGELGLARAAASPGPGDMSQGLALGDEWGAGLGARRRAGQGLANGAFAATDRPAEVRASLGW